MSMNNCAISRWDDPNEINAKLNKPFPMRTAKTKGAYL